MNATRIKRAVVTLLATLLLSVPLAHSQRIGQISGIVVDRSGAVVASASVTLFSDELVRTAVADQNGRFDFRDLPEGPINLEVSSPGFRKVTKGNLQPSDRSLIDIPDPGGCPQCVTVVTDCLSVLPTLPIVPPKVSYEKRLDNVSVAGNVRDAFGGPLSQATVVLANGATSSAYVTLTDDKGEFQFRDVEPGKYQLKATLDNYSEGTAVLFAARENLTRIGVYLGSGEEYRKMCARAVQLESSPLPTELILPR